MPTAFDFSLAPFDRLRPAEIARIEAATDIGFFRKDALVLRRDDLPEHVFVILKGVVEECAAGEVLAAHGPGDAFDTQILLHNTCRHDFVVREEAICHLIPIEDFLDLTANNASFAAYFLDDISERMEALARRHADRSWLGSMATRVREADILPPIVVAPLTTLHEAALAMDAHGQQALLIEDDGRIGIATGVDLARAVARDLRSPQLPLRDIATFDLLAVHPDDFLYEAASLMARRGVRHLVVREEGRVTGVLDAAHVLSSLANRSDALGRLIERASGLDELAEAGARMGPLIRQLHGAGSKVGLVMAISTDLSHAIARRVMEVTAPPGWQDHLCLMAMGSEGRREYLLQTDQDNGLVIADDWAERARDPGFEAFRHRFTEAMIKVGFPACPGEIMVRNGAWSRTVQDWLGQIERWFDTPDEQALMNVAILYDAEAVAGPSALLEPVRTGLIEQARARPAFLARFARAIAMFETPLGLFAQLVTAKGEIDIKKGGLFPLMHGIRALSLERGLRETGTLDRIRELQVLRVLEPALARRLADAFQVLLEARLAGRLEKLRLHQPLDNTLRPAEMPKAERDLLKDALQATKQLKERVAHHFHLQTFG